MEITTTLVNRYQPIEQAYSIHAAHYDVLADGVKIGTVTHSYARPGYRRSFSDFHANIGVPEDQGPPFDTLEEAAEAVYADSQTPKPTYVLARPDPPNGQLFALKMLDGVLIGIAEADNFTRDFPGTAYEYDDVTTQPTRELVPIRAI